MPRRRLKKPNAGTLNPAELKQDNTKTANLKLGPGIDQLGISVSGVEDGRAAAAMLDGPVDSGNSSAQTNDQAANAVPDARCANAAPTGDRDPAGRQSQPRSAARRGGQ